MSDHFPIRAYTPERDDTVRDMRDETEDARVKADALNDAIKADAVHEALGYELASELEGVLARVSVALSRQAQELNDDLGRAA